MRIPRVALLTSLLTEMHGKILSPPILTDNTHDSKNPKSV
jgi:hypothetical protein